MAKYFSNQQIKFIVTLLASSVILAFLILVLIEKMFFLPEGISSPFDLKVSRKTPKVFLEMRVSSNQTSSSEILPVSLYLNTQGKKVDGVGVVILYDPKFLEIDTSGIVAENSGLSRVIPIGLRQPKVFMFASMIVFSPVPFNKKRMAMVAPQPGQPVWPEYMNSLLA